ncbi:hypothetical protein B0I32_10622 [Nonomuraea fuscirosea]|uniref:Glycosyl hydrolase family 65 n=1 Tax=Nonomuraea fuscirosea TaxID=1291556 RepID=A0A2T0N1S0_9ACTN|nr:hypothetical protein [Nonomuraea fuscirosea]PRX65886.1 hypothetical protein B0I32_10622 [Nonomuraea fuscirosea]
MIDRHALAARHAVEVTRILPESPLSVGNGELCFTADLTGLQTFPGSYPVEDRTGTAPGTLLATMASWGWHSMPGSYRLADTTRVYGTARGPVPYVDMRGDLSGDGEDPASAAESWLRANPHRLDLGRIGLASAGGAPFTPGDVSGARQRLDLWTGTLTSRYLLRGAPFHVVTVCHPGRDVISVRLESPALGETGVRLAFPYGSEAWGNAADWTRPGEHTSRLLARAGGGTVLRRLDGTAYQVSVRMTGGGEVSAAGAHEFLITFREPVAELTFAFLPGDAEAEPPGRTGAEALGHAEAEPPIHLGAESPGYAVAEPPGHDEVAGAAARHWPRFWSTGGAVDLSGSRDERAPELERRIVLSQYLTAIHCAGSSPPAETGLIANSWRGRFHLEMHWWHAAHFPLWGRSELLERSLSWYAAILPRARETARAQGCPGARWPKQTGPDGRESPSPIGPFLVWQQPHPIYLAELVRRAAGTRRALSLYGDLVLDTAAFMAAFAVKGPQGYGLGPPLVPAQESYADVRAEAANPTFELAYWSWALRVAQRWRLLLGLPPEPRWAEVAEGMARPLVRDGVYAAMDAPPYTVRDDHPSMLYALGVVPPTHLVDNATMRRTLDDVLTRWNWESTWGWDYPAIAMTATRLGEPDLAVEALLRPETKNTYLPNGHNRQSATLPVYLPGNGGLLTAVALMVKGWDGGPPSPGFPGTWTVRHEGLSPLP